MNLQLVVIQGFHTQLSPGTVYGMACVNPTRIR